jgi:hypothetical protein
MFPIGWIRHPPKRDLVEEIEILETPKKKKKDDDSVTWLHVQQTKPHNADGWWWLHMSFDPSINKTLAQCWLCGDTLAYCTNGTSNTASLKTHLTGKHQIRFGERSQLQLVSPSTTEKLNENSIITKINSYFKPVPISAKLVALEEVAEFWVRAGLAYDQITKEYTKRAFPSLKDVTKRHLLDAIAHLSNSINDNLKTELKGQIVCCEIDGGKKQGKESDC